MSHVPPEVLAFLIGMRDDALTLAAVVFAAIVALHSVKFLLRSLTAHSLDVSLRDLYDHMDRRP